MTTRLLSIPEAALQLGISRIRVWHLVNGERLPAIRLGKFWFIDENDLEKVRGLKPGRPRKSAVCA